VGYSKGIVFFIDILGSKDRTFDESLKISNIFRDELTKVQARQRETSVGNRFVTSFSDCAYIIYEIKTENDKDKIILPYIHTSLYNPASTVAFFVGNGFLCRGGIAYGELYFDKEKNIIFGPAVNEAYSLEQQAKMPRLIFSDELAIKLIEYDKDLKEKNELAKRMNREILLKDDIDTRYFLNYLNPFIGTSCLILGDKPYIFENFYEQVKIRTLNNINEEKSHDTIAKLNWHLKYLELVNDMVCNYEEITQEEMLEFSKRGL
jgi:hypothetical protein